MAQVLNQRTITPRGVGLSDYSNNVEVANVPSYRGRQKRAMWSGNYNSLPTQPMGTFHAFFTRFLVNGVQQYPAPATRHHYFNIEATTGRNALILLGFYRFASLDDALIWNVDKWYGDVWGFGKVTLDYTKGLPTEEGYVYCAIASEYTAFPTFQLRLIIHALNEEIVYG